MPRDISVFNVVLVISLYHVIYAVLPVLWMSAARLEILRGQMDIVGVRMQCISHVVTLGMVIHV